MTHQINLNSEQLIALITKAQAGDTQAQSQLFQEFAGRMKTLCLRYAANHADAEDYLQDGFYQALKHIDKFNFTGSFEGWLRKVVVNNLLRSLKRTTKWKNLTCDPNVELVEIPSNHYNVEDTLSAEDILKTISELPIGYRTVFNMYCIDGYSHQEIADKLGIGEATSRSQLCKAKNLLQQKLL